VKRQVLSDEWREQRKIMKRKIIVLTLGAVRLASWHEAIDTRKMFSI